jgi:hypothetical protein
MRKQVPASETPPRVELLVIPVAATRDPIPEAHELIGCEFAHPPKVGGSGDAGPLIARTVAFTLAALPIESRVLVRTVRCLWCASGGDVPVAESAEPPRRRLRL